MTAVMSAAAFATAPAIAAELPTSNDDPIFDAILKYRKTWSEWSAHLYSEPEGLVSPDEKLAWEELDEVKYRAEKRARDAVTACVPQTPTGLVAYIQFHKNFADEFKYQLEDYDGVFSVMLITLQSAIMNMQASLREGRDDRLQQLDDRLSMHLATYVPVLAGCNSLSERTRKMAQERCTVEQGGVEAVDARLYVQAYEAASAETRVDDALEVCDKLSDEISVICDEVMITPAFTLAGLATKAKAAAFAYQTTGGYQKDRQHLEYDEKYSMSLIDAVFLAAGENNVCKAA